MREKYATSLALSKKLKEAGVVQESEFYWEIGNEIVGSWITDNKKGLSGTKLCSAFLTDELLELLPPRISDKEFVFFFTKKSNDHYAAGYMTKSGYLKSKHSGKTIANTLAKLLLHLTEQGKQ